MSHKKVQVSDTSEQEQNAQDNDGDISLPSENVLMALADAGDGQGVAPCVRVCVCECVRVCVRDSAR